MPSYIKLPVDTLLVYGSGLTESINGFPMSAGIVAGYVEQLGVYGSQFYALNDYVWWNQKNGVCTLAFENSAHTVVQEDNIILTELPPL